VNLTGKLLIQRGETSLQKGDRITGKPSSLGGETTKRRWSIRLIGKELALLSKGSWRNSEKK